VFPELVTCFGTFLRQTLSMNDRVDFFCARPDHQGAQPDDALTMHNDRWAYCLLAAVSLTTGGPPAGCP